ncbi:hypothetical protein OUZ56_030075 [Daphnia magna]|uniref:Uncharacterized protein n=1 Tax=Daphnia magna TaxID=35525 RepID=A0ABQ9ZR44_9CRUS|nr:hypothetical protein OUZ56_030075 [Daphnia magna]
MTSKVYPMGRDRYEYRISAKRTLPIRKRRPRHVNLEIWYVPSTSQTSRNDVLGTSLGQHCVFWGPLGLRRVDCLGVGRADRDRAGDSLSHVLLRSGRVDGVRTRQGRVGKVYTLLFFLRVRSILKPSGRGGGFKRQLEMLSYGFETLLTQTILLNTLSLDHISDPLYMFLLEKELFQAKSNVHVPAVWITEQRPSTWAGKDRSNRRGHEDGKVLAAFVEWDLEVSVGSVKTAKIDGSTIDCGNCISVSNATFLFKRMYLVMASGISVGVVVLLGIKFRATSTVCCIEVSSARRRVASTSDTSPWSFSREEEYRRCRVNALSGVNVAGATGVADGGATGCFGGPNLLDRSKFAFNHSNSFIRDDLF